MNLNSTLLKRMEARTRHSAAQQPPIPSTSYILGSSSAPGSSISSDLQSFISSALRAQLQEHRTQISAEIQQHHTQISAEIVAHREEMTARFLGLRNDMCYFADSMRYMDSQFGALYVKYDMRAPDPTTYARPLPSSGPPFSARPPTAPPAPQPAVAAIDSEEEDDDDDDDDDDGGGDKEMAAGDEEDDDEEDDDDEDDDEE